MKKKIGMSNALLFVGILCLQGCINNKVASDLKANARKNSVQTTSVIEHYADMAEVKYLDSLTTAQQLKTAIVGLTRNATQENLNAARVAWKQARIPYLQTEVYRFGNPIVDDWEGRVNAWPLDEGLIDYVDSSYGATSLDNPAFTANVIANSRFKLSQQVIDASVIDPDLLSSTLHEIDGIEANVASGYHAIEFLLWGQDLNGNNSGAGQRQASDYDIHNCTNGHCQRRIDYLIAVVDLLISDLEWMQRQWQTNGPARRDLLSDETTGLNAILTGMGSLSYGELAGERTKLALLLGDPEEEQDCFSDNTHNAHFYDVQGILNVFMGRYEMSNGEVLQGPSIAQLIGSKDPVLRERLMVALQGSISAAQAIVDSAENNNVAFDQLIAKGNQPGNQLVNNLVDNLLAQTRLIEQSVTVLGLGNIEFEGSDSLDNPTSIFK